MFRSIPGGDDDDDEDGDDMDEGDGEDVGDVFRKVFVDFRCDFFLWGKKRRREKKRSSLQRWELGWFWRQLTTSFLLAILCVTSNLA